MKKILAILLIIIITSACKSIHETIKPLDLGMDKNEVILKIGNNYSIESRSNTPDGKLEVLRYPRDYYPAYLLVFLDDELIEIQKDHQPVVPEQNVNITTKDKEN